MTAALEGGEWSAARPGHTLLPGKTRYPFYRRLGWPQGRSGRAENLVPTGIGSRTVQSLYRLSYPAHTNIINNIFVRRTIHCSSISYMFQPQQVTITPIQHYVKIFNNFPPPLPPSLSLSLMYSPLGPRPPHC